MTGYTIISASQLSQTECTDRQNDGSWINGSEALAYSNGSVAIHGDKTVYMTLLVVYYK